VIVNDINRESAEDTVEAMAAARERGCAHQADVSDSGAVRAMFEEVKQRFRDLDVLVNNAGIAETGNRRDEINRKGEAQLQELLSGGPIQSHWDVTASLSDEEWRQMMDVHLGGTFFCTREALKLMAAKNSGLDYQYLECCRTEWNSISVALRGGQGRHPGVPCQNSGRL
jgi:3-oxoacyl-[acyl-carrier protein] reductase